jgi:hypothetical protein
VFRKSSSDDLSRQTPAPVEGVDFYREGAYVVFTAAYHLRRGRCCESGCRHCPYRVGSEDAPAAEEKKDEA